MADKEEYLTCVRCGNITEKKDAYCIVCGAPLRNKCTDEPGLLSKGCKFVNVSTAAYCAKCGEPTVFNKLGLLADPWPRP